MRENKAKKAEEVALFRYTVISEAISERLSPAERGMVVRALAAGTWVTPEGTERSFSRKTIDRWAQAYKAHGLAGLEPVPRADKGRPRAELATWLAEAARMRRELPARSSSQIVDAIGRAHRVVLSERTVREHLQRVGLSRRALSAEPAKAFGRYEASRSNEIWIGDVLHGPFVPHPRVPGSKRAKLFLLVDDYSRLLVYGHWTAEENTRAGQDVLRSAIARRGLPEILHVDNGAPYANHQLTRACAVLGVRLVHSRPYRPQGRGKQERLNSYVRASFIAEMEQRGITGFDELNDFFVAWAEQVANRRCHAETHEAPIERWAAAGFAPTHPSPSRLAEAFRWSVLRRVSKTATVSFQANRYAVGPALVGKVVELRFDPEDLTRISVYLNGEPAGEATAFVIGRHVHPAVPQAPPPPPAPEEGPGIDYMALVAKAEAVARGEGSIDYRVALAAGSLGDGTGATAGADQAVGFDEEAS